MENIILSLLGISHTSSAFEAKVTAVTDGDAVKIEYQNKIIKVMQISLRAGVMRFDQWRFSDARPSRKNRYDGLEKGVAPAPVSQIFPQCLFETFPQLFFRHTQCVEWQSAHSQ